MIVCVCNNVNSKTIEDAISSGANTIEEIRAETTATSCCGKCQFKVNRILHDSEMTPTASVACMN